MNVRKTVCPHNGGFRYEDPGPLSDDIICKVCKLCGEDVLGESPALPVTEKASELSLIRESARQYTELLEAHNMLEARLQEAMELLRTLKELLEDHGHSERCVICKGEVERVRQFLNGGGK